MMMMSFVGAFKVCLQAGKSLLGVRSIARLQGAGQALEIGVRLGVTAKRAAGGRC